MTQNLHKNLRKVVCTCNISSEEMGRWVPGVYRHANLAKLVSPKPVTDPISETKENKVDSARDTTHS